jgi:hypothetical protein
MDDLISRLETADFDVPIPRGGATPRALDYAIHVAIGGWITIKVVGGAVMHIWDSTGPTTRLHLTRP